MSKPVDSRPGPEVQFTAVTEQKKTKIDKKTADLARDYFCKLYDGKTSRSSKIRKEATDRDVEIYYDWLSNYTLKKAERCECFSIEEMLAHFAALITLDTIAKDIQPRNFIKLMGRFFKKIGSCLRQENRLNVFFEDPENKKSVKTILEYCSKMTVDEEDVDGDYENLRDAILNRCLSSQGADMDAYISIYKQLNAKMESISDKRKAAALEEFEKAQAGSQAKKSAQEKCVENCKKNVLLKWKIKTLDALIYIWQELIKKKGEKDPIPDISELSALLRRGYLPCAGELPFAFKPPLMIDESAIRGKVTSLGLNYDSILSNFQQEMKAVITNWETDARFSAAS